MISTFDLFLDLSTCTDPTAQFPTSHQTSSLQASRLLVSFCFPIPFMEADRKEFAGGGAPPHSWKDVVREFVFGAAEMIVELGKGCRAIVAQSFGAEDSFVVRNFGKDSFLVKRMRGPYGMLCGRLRYFNEFLVPEDKDPLHVWSIFFFVFLLAFAALSVCTERDTSVPTMKKVYMHPPSAHRILLPDGRYMAYREQGVSSDKARHSLLAPPSFLSSRLSGIPGLKVPLLEEFGVRLLTYDLPGFGESDPHPSRDLKSSAFDMLFLANAVSVNGKFWVIGYSSGALHAWAALRFIPDRLAGVALFAPFVNPYDSLMNKDEKYRMWQKWSSKRKFMFFLARRFPSLLSYFYLRSFLSGKHGQVDKWLSLSLGKRDRALIEDPVNEEYWQRDVEEATRQGHVKPFTEEAVLQVSNWGFSLAELKLQKKQRGKGLLNLIKSLLSASEEQTTGFLGPIHVWQGMDDKVVPPSMTDFVHRVLPGAAIHKLPYEGHFTYYYFCDECHRQIFTTLFGTPQGPLYRSSEVLQETLASYREVQEKEGVGKVESSSNNTEIEDLVSLRESNFTSSKY